MHGWLIESEDGWTLLRPEFPVCEAMVDDSRACANTFSPVI
jgi:hypothetical protein